MTEQQIDLQMRVFNERIGETERTLEWLYEQCREFINRHNLNKVVETAVSIALQNAMTGTDLSKVKGEFLLSKGKSK